MLSISWLFALVVASISMGFFWQLIHPPTPLRLAPVASWTERWAPEAGTRLMRRWNQVTKDAAKVFAVTPAQVGVQSALFGGVTAAALWFVIRAPLWVALPAGLLVGWQLPPYLLKSRYIRWRQAVLGDFPTITLLLRIYWDLGYSVPESLLAVRPAIGPAMQGEVDRILGDIAQGERGSAWTAFSQRVHHSSIHLLAQVVRQNWDRKLSGEALNPLDTLVETTRVQQLTALTDQLDAVSTVVPILAIMGMITVFIFALYLSLHL